MLNRFAQNPAWKEVLITKGIGFIDQQKIESPLQRQILKTIIKDESVATEFPDCIRTCLHAVFIAQHYHPR